MYFNPDRNVFCVFYRSRNQVFRAFHLQQIFLTFLAQTLLRVDRLNYLLSNFQFLKSSLWKWIISAACAWEIFSIRKNCSLKPTVDIYSVTKVAAFRCKWCVLFNDSYRLHVFILNENPQRRKMYTIIMWESNHKLGPRHPRWNLQSHSWCSQSGGCCG